MWRAAPAESIMVTTMADGLALAYDRRSGQTHLLAPPLPELLSVLSGDTPRDAAAIAKALAEQYDVREQGDEASTAVAAHMDDLVRLGLVAVEPTAAQV